MMSSIKSTFLVFFLAVFMVIGLGQPAHADLVGVGQVNPATGFPVWFKGADGTSLGLCDRGGTAPEQPPCLLELVVSNGNVVAENIVEALYYGATAVAARGEESYLAICAVEAAGPGGPAGTVSNVALVRLRNLPLAGEYNVTTPCGQFTLIVTDPAVDIDLRGNDSTIGATPGFGGTLVGNVQMFAGNGTGPAGFLGDGVTPALLRGPLSPGGGTSFEVTGPVGYEPFSTNLFSVVGKVFALAPVGGRARVTFWRDATGAGTIDFYIPQSPGAVSAQAVGVGLPLPGQPVRLTLAGGFFKASVPITANNILPGKVEVTFNLGVVGETKEIFPLTQKRPLAPWLLLLRKETEE